MFVSHVKYICVTSNIYLRRLFSKSLKMPPFQSIVSKGKGECRKMSSNVKPTETLDVRGEVCPYPDVKTQKKLKKMKSGEILEVLLDYPLSAERIPRSVEKLGHEVLKTEKTGTGEWRILIKIK